MLHLDQQSAKKILAKDIQELRYPNNFGNRIFTVFTERSEDKVTVNCNYSELIEQLSLLVVTTAQKLLNERPFNMNPAHVLNAVGQDVLRIEEARQILGIDQLPIKEVS